MKNANEIAVIAKNAINDKINSRKAQAEKICEEQIAPAIEQAASNGELSIKFHVSADADIHIVMVNLSELGYEVKKKGYELTISWMSNYFNL